MNKKNFKDLIRMLPKSIILVGADYSGISEIGKLISLIHKVQFVEKNPKIGFPEIVNLLTEHIDQKDEKSPYIERIVDGSDYTHLCHSYHNTLGAVIFIIRDMQAIIRDRNNIKDFSEDKQKKYYKLFFPQVNTEQSIAKIKREVFVKWQMPARPNTFFMDYDLFHINR
jgi:hypothetical protein